MPHLLDYKKMRKAVGVDDSVDIIAAIQAEKCRDRKAAMWAAVEEVELEGLKQLKLREECVSVLQSVSRLSPPPHILNLYCPPVDVDPSGSAEDIPPFQMRSVPMALITRNAQKNIKHFFRAAELSAAELGMWPIMSRDSKIIKPDPSVLTHVAKLWQLPSIQNLLMVGDSHRDDILCGRAAGAQTMLIVNETSPDGHHRGNEWALKVDDAADYHGNDLSAVIQVIAQSWSTTPSS